MHEKTLSERRVFAGRLLNVDVVEVELPCGLRSSREIVRHPGGVVILAELPDGRFVFVRQFRKPLETVLTEVVAGTLHAGEDPALCAGRELQEETGYRAAHLERLGTITTAPGYTAERLHVFYARLEEPPQAIRPDEDERIEVVLLNPHDVERMILSEEIWDGKTLAAWCLWKTRRAARRRRP
jgi:ADP-ribose pyrophosphatase